MLGYKFYWVLKGPLCVALWLLCGWGRPFLLLLHPTALSLATSLCWCGGDCGVEWTETCLSSSPCSGVVGLKLTLRSRDGTGFLLWQQRAHREGWGFDINSTLILYLCSTVQSASIWTGLKMFALYSSILDLKWQLGLVTALHWYLVHTRAATISFN